MTEPRKHIVDDMAKHISGDLIRSFRLQVHQMAVAGVSPTEGAAISAIVAKQLLVACVGGAVVLTGNPNRKMAFAMLINKIVEDVIANEATIHANLDEAVATGMRRAAS